MSNLADCGPFRPGVVPGDVGHAARVETGPGDIGRSTRRGWTGRPPTAPSPNPNPGSPATIVRVGLGS